MNHPINWFEIPAIDLERAMNFYKVIFKREFHFIEMPNSKMYMFLGASGDNPKGAGGAIVKSEKHIPSVEGSIVYFTSLDIDTELGRVETAGGKVLQSRTSIGEFGFTGIFIDTEGNKIGLHAR